MTSGTPVTTGPRQEFVPLQPSLAPASLMFDHYRRSSIGVEHLSTTSASGFWNTGTWLSPHSANYFHRRRSSHPKICTFNCANCRKLMLGSVSERSLNAIDSMSPLSEAKSIEQNLANSDQQLSSTATTVPPPHTTMTAAVSDSQVCQLQANTEKCFNSLQTNAASGRLLPVSNISTLGKWIVETIQNI